MKIRPLLPARIEKGKILWQNPVMTAQVMRELEGEQVKVSIKPFTKTRSLNQNAYYWAVIIATLADFTGYSTDEMHEVLRVKFLPYKANVGNEEVTITKSTTDLDTTEFEKYLAEIREWASVALEVFLPLPGEISL